ncbi:hypothetical protein [Paenibacillus yanchengensis]|uniref:Uncharacterized protein n=1 Tax=Paenibacillus yanchengensis TaxID=2035833 RepID=A0ABW4YG29_9BACL
MRLWLKSIIVIIFSLFLSTVASLPPVQAGFFDRVKDIYQAPEKIKEITEEYDASRQKLEEELTKQEGRLNEMKESNEYYRAQTELLAAENENLMLKMEKIEQDRKKLYQNLVIIFSSIIGVFVLYALAIRVWRLTVWIKQGRVQNRRKKLR